MGAWLSLTSEPLQLWNMAVHMSRGGRLVVPASIRKALNLVEGTALILEVEGSGIRLTPIDEPIDRIQALAHTLLVGVPSHSEELIAERRWDAQRDCKEDSRNE